MEYVNPAAIARGLLLVAVFGPLAAAVACALIRTRAREYATVFAGLHLLAVIVLTALASFDLTHRGESLAHGIQPELTFTPIHVPGDPGHSGDTTVSTYHTTWGLLRLAPSHPDVPPSDVQLFLGLDGLNVWLIALSSLMTLVAVLISWKGVTERPGGYYGWLFALTGTVTGAFASFDVVLFYVFFELTLVPAFFLIGSWGVGGGRRDAARKFFLYTLLGSLFTLAGIVGLVLTNPTPIHPGGPGGNEPRTMVGLPRGLDGDFVFQKPGPVTFSIPQLAQNADVWATNKFAHVRIAEWKYEAAAEAAKTAETRLAAAADDPDRQRAAQDARDALGKAGQAKADADADRDAHLRTQTILLILLMAGFAVKIPLVPFHTWLPAAYAEAPTAVTMLLAALLAKLGTFGVLRIVLPTVPDAALAYGLPVFGGLGAAGIVYAALCAYAQRDVKLMVAYGSVSHLGFLVIGLFAFNAEGVGGAALHMVNHGLATGALFALLAFLSDRYRTLDMNQYGGLWAKYPGYTFLVVLVALATIGVPGLNNFVSEMLMLAGVFRPPNTDAVGYWLGAAAALGILLSAWYTLTMVRRVFFGPLAEPPSAVPLKGLRRREVVAFGLPAVLCVLLGVFPQPVLDTMSGDVAVLTYLGDRARQRAGIQSPPPKEKPRPAGPAGGQPPGFPGGAGGPGGGKAKGGKAGPGKGGPPKNVN